LNDTRYFTVEASRRLCIMGARPQAPGLVQLAVRCGRLRASPHVYNTDREIDQLVEALPKH